MPTNPAVSVSQKLRLSKVAKQRYSIRPGQLVPINDDGNN